LIQRDDDKEETVKKTPGVYSAQTRPLVDYYSNWARPSRQPRRNTAPSTAPAVSMRSRRGPLRRWLPKAVTSVSNGPMPDRVSAFLSPACAVAQRRLLRQSHLLSLPLAGDLDGCPGRTTCRATQIGGVAVSAYGVAAWPDAGKRQSDQSQSAWFRHTIQGQVIDKEGIRGRSVR